MHVCDPKTIRSAAKFSMKEPLTAQAAKQNAARMVTEIVAETRKAIASVIQRAVSEGIAPAKAARMIRPLVGLTQRQANAVMNAQLGWEAAGLSPELAMKRAEFYAAKLLRQRASTIARTEILRASNQGQLAAWRQAAQSGLIQEAKTRRVWIASEGACPICIGLNGEYASLSGSFKGGIAFPPLHPNCRCTTGLITLPASNTMFAEQTGAA